jgi:hypothetical protein
MQVSSSQVQALTRAGVTHQLSPFSKATGVANVPLAAAGVAPGVARACAVFLNAAAGLRVSEALGLKWSDVDFAHGHLLLRRISRLNGSRNLGKAPDKPASTSFPAKKSIRRSPPRGRPGAKPGHSRAHEPDRSRHQCHRLRPAAARWAPAQIFVLALGGPLQLCVSANIYAEYEEVISRPRFKGSEEIIASALRTIRDKGFGSVQPRACTYARTLTTTCFSNVRKPRVPNIW